MAKHTANMEVKEGVKSEGKGPGDGINISSTTLVKWVCRKSNSSLKTEFNLLVEASDEILWKR